MLASRSKAFSMGPNYIIYIPSEGIDFGFKVTKRERLFGTCRCLNIFLNSFRSFLVRFLLLILLRLDVGRNNLRGLK